MIVVGVSVAVENVTLQQWSCDVRIVRYVILSLALTPVLSFQISSAPNPIKYW